MYKNVLNTCRLSAILLTIGLFQAVNTQAQISLTGQLRDRAEIRNGYGNLITTDAQQSGFISQRTRLNFGYKWDLLTIGSTLQDIRVFGADASTISTTDNRLFMHEAWAELTLANKADTNVKFKLLDLLTFKIGRQELIYDDARLIGNLDWLQQGRAFDMGLLKAVHHGWQVDLGYAFNQNTDALSTNSDYVPGNIPLYVKTSTGVLVPAPAGLVPLAAGGSAGNNSSKAGTPVYANPPSTNGATQNYKSFKSLYISKKIDQTKFSALFFNDDFGSYRLDSVGSVATGYVYGRRFVQASTADAFDYSPIHRYTYGLMVNHTIGNASSSFGKIAIQAAYYQQSGKNRDNVDLDAYHYTVALTYQKGRFSFTPGYDVLSGNDAVSPSGKDNRFDPLYGTPHKFWGYMDYFYAGSGSPAGGLQNPYFKVKYTANTLALGLDLHHFALNNDMKKGDGTVLDKNLGNEIDAQLSYTMNKFTNIEVGYSVYNATHNLPFAKGQVTTEAAAGTYNKVATWGYVMFKFTPDFFYAKPVAIKQ